MSDTVKSSLRTALRTAVLATSGLPTVQGWDNVEFTPAVTDSWMLEARLSSLPRQQATMGSTSVASFVRLEFLYEIHFGVPKQASVEDLDTYVGKLFSSFRPGTRFTVESTNAVVLSAQDSSTMYPSEYPGHAVVACTFLITMMALNT